MLVVLVWSVAARAEPPIEAEDPLYVEHCATCHGRRGRATFPGVMMGAGSFASASFWEGRPGERLRRAVVEGGPAVGLKKAMPAFGDRLTPEEIDRVLAVALSFRAPDVQDLRSPGS
jgi:mono/diheme cytochrome c family protein